MKLHQIACVLVASVLLAGCPKPLEKHYDAQLPPGQSALRRIDDPARLPDLAAASMNVAGLRQAAANSLNYLSKPSSREHFPIDGITHARVVASVRHLVELLDSGLGGQELADVIRARYDVYESVGCDGAGTVLFTGYYTPVLEASPSRTEHFRWPLYRTPPGLVKLPDGNPASPMPDRRAIEESQLYAGNELVWLSDPFEAFVAHIQGSAHLRMTDGSRMTIGYAANNGHQYRSIRAELVQDGKVPRYAGLGAMIEYFRANPHQVSEYTWRNPRYVFFAPVADGQPRGSLNEPVMPMRSIATDKRIFPRGSLALISTHLPRRVGAGVQDAPHVGFVLDQDTGGAIRAPGRCDVYMGAGDQAGALAGRVQNEGRLYYLLLKDQFLPPSP